MNRIKPAVLFVVTSLLFVLSLNAQERTPVLEARKISENVMSPFCPGRTLHDCPSSSATELKHKISDMVTAGQTPEEIYEYLYSVYGEGIRAIPRKRGFGLVAWITPFAFLLLGLLVLYAWLKRHQRNAPKVPAAAPGGTTLDEETIKRINSEL